jgi:DNA-binding CsgD family transcriptional regulator
MTMNDPEARYDELLALAYACVLERSTWSDLLGRVSEACGRQRGILMMWDAQQPYAQIALFHQNEAAAAEAYSRHFYELDPTGPAMEHRDQGVWYHDYLELGPERMSRSPYYQEFKRPHGMRGVSCLKLQHNDNHSAYLSLLTNQDARDPHLDQQRMLDRITPHLVRASQMSNVVEGLKLQLQTRQLLQEQHATPLWLVNGEGRVLFCNTAAEQRLGEPGFPLRQRNDRLSLSLPGVELLTLIRQACGRAGPARPGWVRLPGVEPAQLLVTPVRAEARFNLIHQQPLALVTLLDARPRAELLTELFQFTPAECRLAELIVRGQNPEECARRLGVSINTVRSQLRALFAKTGTQKQAEFVGLISRISR